jgi:DNA-binding transcriptional MerR regulator
MADDRDPIQIGRFADLVGLSIPQLRRYDRLRLLQPARRSAESGYRYYTLGQTGAARVISLLRSVDMPIAEIRRILGGVGEAERREILRDHRGRLETRLDEVRSLLAAVDALSTESDAEHDARTEMSGWLHVMPQLPVHDLDRSIAYYEEALGFQLAWRTADAGLAAVASGWVEMLLLVPWPSATPYTPQSAYVYVDDPDALCAEYREAGANIIDPVASRSYGMRDFVVQDPDGHRFTLGKGEDRLHDMADHFDLASDEIGIDPSWLHRHSSGPSTPGDAEPDQDDEK